MKMLTQEELLENALTTAEAILKVEEILTKTLPHRPLTNEESEIYREVKLATFCGARIIREGS